MSSDPSSRSVNQLWEEFKEVVDKAVTSHVPHKVNKSHNPLPWINKPIKKDMKLCKRLYNKAKRTSLQNDWDTYRTLRNSINTKLKGAHNEYYSKLFDNSFKGNRRQFWRYIRAKQQDKPDIPALLVNSHPVHSAKGKCLEQSL